MRVASWLATVVLAASTVTAIPAHAQERILVRLPDCTTAHLDMALLRELLPIELEDIEGDEIVVTLSVALCDPSLASVDVTLRDIGTGRAGGGSIAVELGGDPASRARTIALAIAERARLVYGRRTVGDVAETPPAEEVAAVLDPVPAPREARAEPSLPRETLGPPLAPEPDTVEPSFDVPLELQLVGRVAPVLPSWALGLRAALRTQLDPSWSLRVGLVGTWSRATPSHRDHHAVVVALEGAALLSLVRASGVSLALGATLEAGALVATGSNSTGSGRTTVSAA
jgi:hypothetical protein